MTLDKQSRARRNSRARRHRSILLTHGVEPGATAQRNPSRPHPVLPADGNHSPVARRGASYRRRSTSTDTSQRHRSRRRSVERRAHPNLARQPRVAKPRFAEIANRSTEAHGTNGVASTPRSISTVPRPTPPVKVVSLIEQVGQSPTGHRPPPRSRTRDVPRRYFTVAPAVTPVVIVWRTVTPNWLTDSDRIPTPAALSSRSAVGRPCRRYWPVYR